MSNTILVTGGAGYIGSHTSVELLVHGYNVVIVDDLSNSHPEAVERIKTISGKDLTFVKADLRDRAALETVFMQQPVHAVIHFAGLKAVGESVDDPLRYYHANLGSTLVLLDTMQQYGVNNIVFSSSATVYGDPASLPIKESAALHPTNPYGQTKYMIEQILADLSIAKNTWNITSLRYFNPVGAHPSGLIGEDPQGTPNNLLPYVSQVAAGKRDELTIFGNDYDTVDGTGVRDYVHVVDLAQAHVAALTNLGGHSTYNIGTGNGTSVLEIISAFEKASSKQIPYRVAARRAGDIASCYADTSLAKHELHWQAQYSILDACKDAWKWQSQNPNGYTSKPNTIE
jgi:UDP-glucose 4-epimerase